MGIIESPFCVPCTEAAAEEYLVPITEDTDADANLTVIDANSLYIATLTVYYGTAY